MSKPKSKMNTVFRRISRAFAAKDERAFEDAMDDLEESMDSEGEAEEPDTIEVHNHMPDSMRDTMGEMPPKEMVGPQFDRRGRDEEEAPPWAKKMQEANDARFKSMNDSMEAMMKGKKEMEGMEDEDPYRPEEPDENLEMMDRMMDRMMKDMDDPMMDRMAMKDRMMKDRMAMKDRMKDRRMKDRMKDVDDPMTDSMMMDRRDEANREILGELEYEAPPGTGDRARRAKDSAFLSEAFQDATAKAEILAPGIALPTFDAKASPARVIRTIGKLRRAALDLAYVQPASRGVIEQALSGRALDSAKLPLGQVRVLFNSVAAQVGTNNNARAMDRSSLPTRDSAPGQGQPRLQSLADMNRFNREKFSVKR